MERAQVERLAPVDYATTWRNAAGSAVDADGRSRGNGAVIGGGGRPSSLLVRRR